MLTIFPLMSYQSSEVLDTIAPLKSAYECHGCDELSPGVSYCSVCELSLCDRCWNGQLVHRPRFVSPGSKAHEKTDPLVAQQISNVFLSAHDVSTSQQLHSEDEKSAWFGMAKLCSCMRCIVPADSV